MQLSLSKLSWQAQIGAFVAVCLCATAGFWYFFVLDAQAELAMRRTRLTSLRADAARGMATVRRLPEFEGQVSELEGRLQGLATQSNLSIQRFTPQPMVQQPMYAEVPFKIQAEGSYHNLGAFFERISKFPRIINISNISIKAKPTPGPGATIVAEAIATTFVLQDSKAAGKGKSTVPKQPSLGK